LAGFNTAPIEKVSVGLIEIMNRGKAFIRMFDWLIEKEKAISCERFNIGIKYLTMKKLLTILMILPFFGFGQWTKFYHNNQMQFISNAEQTTDSGFIVSGVTKAPGSTSGGNDYDMIIMKTDINGDSLWSKVFGGYEEDVVNKVIQTSDGGYALVGYSDNLDSNNVTYSFILKTDANGDSLWMKPLTRNDEVFSFEQTSDGGYIVVGKHFSIYGVLIKTNALGDTLWTRILEDTLYNYSAAYDVKQTIDGGYIIIGEIGPNSNNNNDNAFIVKTDSNGYTLWSNTFGGSSIDFSEGHSIEQTTDGGYIYTGYLSDTTTTGVYFLLVKTDDLGNTIWWKKYQVSLYQTAAFNVQQTTDGGYIIGGVSIEWTGSYDLLIIKTNDVGDTTWTRQINYGEEDFGSIQQTTDGGYIIAAHASNPAWNNYADLTLIKLDASGNIISSTLDVALKNPNRKLMKITNVLGQETTEKKNTPLFYIYDDGTVEKKIVIE